MQFQADREFSPLLPSLPVFPNERECGTIYQFFGQDYQAGRQQTLHLSGMKRKTANIDSRVEPQLLERIDAWRAR